MKKQQDKNGLLDLSKLSLDDFKKTDQDKKCKSKDFQPFLEYSLWHFFGSVVGKFIKGCRETLNFLEHPIGESHVLTYGKELENQTIQTLSKSITATAPLEGTKKRELRIKTMKENRKKPLYELVAHKRKYSKFSKD